MRRTFVVLLVALIAFTGLALASEEEQHTAAFVIAGSRATPEYPPAALAAGFEGSVTVAAVINEDGSVGAVEVVDSTNSKLGFEEAALDAFRQWRFAPAVQDGEPVFSVWAYSFYFSSPRGRLNPSPYVSGDFMVSTLVGPGAFRDFKVGAPRDGDGNISPSAGRKGRLHLSTPNKIPCRTLGCMYDRSKILPPQRFFRNAPPPGAPGVGAASR